ncbi:hypothetical protein [Marinilactibacillus sp. Marseille-P9653]|uniref:hypothetical protein n=1 Tax=Marinilactibacillus sp. Marseille-P9653 TaxID=2866583 RepID=UPI001CE3D4B7|nr:hypothetical protein [Marinilactibacillus sp. Marseille-P9653]
MIGLGLLAGCSSTDTEVEDAFKTATEESNLQETSEETAEPNQISQDEVESVQEEIPRSVLLDKTFWSFDKDEEYDLTAEVGLVLIEGNYAILSYKGLGKNQLLTNKKNNENRRF